MKPFKIITKNRNLEVLSKIINSVATKYNCSVTYNDHVKSLYFSGEDTCKRFIAEETMELFNSK